MLLLADTSPTSVSRVRSSMCMSVCVQECAVVQEEPSVLGNHRERDTNRRGRVCCRKTVAAASASASASVAVVLWL